MNKNEAKMLINELLEVYRSKTYDELVEMIDAAPVTGGRNGENGGQYQYEIQAFWDDQPQEDVRVIGNIDDGGIRANFPLCDDFIKSPANEFVGE